jgi:3-isopropylmalate dehydrogenase
MAKYKIAWMPGDGIGKDVLNAAKIVLDALNFDAEYLPCDVGWEFWKKEGNPLPERTIETMKKTDCALFGAITSKPQTVAEKELDPELVGKGYRYKSPIVHLRQLFDLYTCFRPCHAYQGNPLNYKEGIDIVIFRENTEDLYAGVEFETIPQDMFKIKGMEKVPRDASISVKVITPKGSRRICRATFEWAKENGKKRVTCVHKANVVRAADGLFLKIFEEVARDFPEITADNANIDSLCMWLLKNPLDYQVLVAPNLYGDIISDLCSQMVGGLGFASSGNMGDDYALFEPTHGSAPKYAGKDKVNPIATILAASQMLDWLGEHKLCNKIKSTVEKVVREGKVRTYDMGGNATTTQMANEIASKID